MKKRAVMVDLDNTLFDFSESLCLHYNEAYGTLLSKHDIVSWDLQTSPNSGGASLREFFDAGLPSGFYINMCVIIESLYAIYNLIDKGVVPVFITARPVDVSGDSKLSLSHYNLKDCPLIFTKNKVKEIRGLLDEYEFIGAFEDSINEIQAIADSGLSGKCFLLNHPYNLYKKTGENINRVDSLLQAVRRLL